MGLDFSHGNARWSYSGFNTFRIKLAREIGIDLQKMSGFNLSPDSMPWENIIDPIVYLLNHSDCDGELSPAKCKLIAPRLRKLVSNWDKKDYDRVTALELAKGMDKATKEKKKFRFI